MSQLSFSNRLRELDRGLALAGCVLGVLLFWVPDASGHEPVFGLGPHTLYEGGVSTSLSYEQDVRVDSEDATRATLGLTYGVTADLNLALGVPYVIHKPGDEGHVRGVGDPVVQVKWRPWTSMSPGNIDALALIGGIKLPAGREGISPGNAAYVLGATLARENQRYYLFSSARFIAQTTGIRGKPGNAFLYSASAGVRPFILEYDQPDLVVLAEINGRSVSAFRESEASLATAGQALGPSGPEHTYYPLHSGGTTTVAGGSGEGGTELAVSPNLLLSWGPVMLKGGVQLPFWATFPEGADPGNLRIKTDLIVQF